MSLIEYVDPGNFGELYIGLGMMFVLLTIAYVIYSLYTKIISWLNVSMEKDKKYALLESLMLDRIAEKKSINLSKELLKYNVIDPLKKKKFRKKIEDEVFKELFGEEVKEESTD